MLTALILIAPIALFIALQFAITPLDRYLSIRLWRGARMAQWRAGRVPPVGATRPAAARPARLATRRAVNLRPH